MVRRGQLPNFVAPDFCATLTALNKNKTGIRPTDVGKVIRRLVSKLQKEQPSKRSICLEQSSWDLLSVEVPRA